MARTSVAGVNTDISVIVVAMVISVLIVFFTGYLILIFQPNSKGIENAPKWGAFFVMVWLTSLLLVVIIDALPFWLGYTRITTTIIEGIFGPDAITSNINDLLRSVLFGILAFAILVYKTKQMDNSFQPFERCALVTFAFGLLVNTTLLEFFVYGHGPEI